MTRPDFYDGDDSGGSIWWVPERGEQLVYWTPDVRKRRCTVVFASESQEVALVEFEDGSKKRVSLDDLYEHMEENPSLDVYDMAPNLADAQEKLLKRHGKRRMEGVELVVAHVAWRLLPKKPSRVVFALRDGKVEAFYYTDRQGKLHLDYHGTGARMDTLHIETPEETAAWEVARAEEHAEAERRAEEWREERRRQVEASGRSSLLSPRKKP